MWRTGGREPESAALGARFKRVVIGGAVLGDGTARERGNEAKPIQIRMGGYGPATTGFSRGAETHRRPARSRSSATASASNTSGTSWISATAPRTSCGWSRRPADARLSVVELPDRPGAGAGLVDLPFLFAHRRRRAPRSTARSGRRCAQDRGARRLPHPRLLRERLPPYLEPARRPHAGGPARTAHPRAAEQVQERTFELLGAVPLRLDLTEAIAAITAGTIDAQENPLSQHGDLSGCTNSIASTRSPATSISRGRSSCIAPRSRPGPTTAATPCARR